VAWPAGLSPPAPSPARIRRPALTMSLVFTLMVALCLGGGLVSFVVVQSAEPRGTPSPEAAVEGFLRAIFTEHSANSAAGFVCSDIRDNKELARLVFEVKAFERRYASPRTTWTYPPVQRTGAREASADVTLTLTTQVDQVAEKEIRLLLVDDRGWWVCDVETPE
jgi:hypothetical protein